MFGKIATFAVTVCALSSRLVAGDVGTLKGTDPRSVKHYAGHRQTAGLRPAHRQAPAWPPQRPSRQCPVARTWDIGHAGSFGDAFMVDTGVTPVPAAGSQYSCGAASNGNGWRVIWSDQMDGSVRTSGIDRYGTLHDADGIPVSDFGPSSPGLSRTMTGLGSDFFAVWCIADYDVWGARLDSTGAPVDSFLIHESADGQTAPAVAFDGDSTCLVVWTENPYGNSDVYAKRVTPAGQVLDTLPIRVAQESSRLEGMPTVAFGQGVFLVAWQAIDTSYTAVFALAAMVSPDGVLLDSAIFLRHDPGMMQAYPAVGFGDTCFLAAWSEGLEQPDLFVARISTSGNLIDSSGVQLSSSPDYDLYSSIGFDGSRYLIMWCEIDQAWETGPLCGRRVTVDGVPLDSGLIRPGLPGYVCSFPSVAADDSNFLVAFSAYENSNWEDNVYCTRISPEGVVLDSVISFPIGEADPQYGASGSSDGTDFLAVWTEERAQGHIVQAARIAADGTLLDSVGREICEVPGTKYHLASAYGDSLYLVAWEDFRGRQGPDIYCARVTQDGQVLDPDGIVVCDEMSYQEWPDVSFDGQNLLVVWQDDRSGSYVNIYGARISPTGTVLDPDGFAITADTFSDRYPAVCFTGTNHLVVWQGESNREIDIHGALVSPAGVVIKPRFLVSGAQGEQMLPVVARGPTNCLVVWEDMRQAAGYDVYAARVQADGTVLDPNGIIVAETSGDEWWPRVTADENGFRVVWYYPGSLAVARVDTSGTVTRSGDWFELDNPDLGFDVVQGGGPELLALFSAWTDSAQGRYYGVDRLWGKLDAVPGVEEGPKPHATGFRHGPTIVRGILFLPRSLDASISRSLLDISGRKVLDLIPGANDVGVLSPGVYFVREEPQAVRKVVIAP